MSNYNCPMSFFAAGKYFKTLRFNGDVPNCGAKLEAICLGDICYLLEASLPEPVLGKGKRTPCPGPRASEPLCDTAAFLSSSFHVTARMAKFCNTPVIYCQVPQSAAVNGG